MYSKKTKSKRNQLTRFAKIVILLTPFIVAAAGATLYQESRSHSLKVTTTSHPAHSKTGTGVGESSNVEEPFSDTDSVHFTSSQAALLRAPPSDIPNLAQVPAKAQAHSVADRYFMFERFDRIVVNR